MLAWPRPLVLGLALALSVVVGTMNSSCVIPDKCIVVIVSGTDWCSEVVGAQKWPAGQPNFAEAVKDANGDWPVGCTCYNSAENKILQDQIPEDKYAEFVAEMQQAGRNNCNLAVPAGWDHNCYDEAPEGPVFVSPSAYATGSCVGDCAYINPPRDGCGSDPSPYECEADYGDGTDGGDSPINGENDSTTPDVQPSLDREVQSAW